MKNKMIRGKYDSLCKRDANGRKVRGTYATAMQYACRVKGGVAAIQQIRNQPWESWKVLTNR